MKYKNQHLINDKRTLFFSRFVLSALVLLLLPEFLMVNFSLGSLSIGNLISFIAVVMLFIPNFRIERRVIFILVTSIFFLLTLIFIGGINNLAGLNLTRFFLGLPILFFQVLVAMFITNSLNNDINAAKHLSSIYTVLLVIGYLNFVLITFGLNNKATMIFFTEPSHYAMAFSPFIIYKFIIERKILLHLILLIFLATILGNSTLLVTLLVAIAARTRFNFKFNYLSIMIFLSIMVVLVFFLSAGFQERLLSVVASSPTENSNVSALVYIQGWEYIIHIFREKEFFGHGFNQMGLNHTQTVSSQILEDLGLFLNQNDGSFLLSKLIVELGIFGLLIALISMIIIIKFIFNLNRLIKNTDITNISPVFIFFTSVSLAFILLLLVRNTNYFNSTITLFLSAIFFYRNVLKSHNNFKKNQHV